MTTSFQVNLIGTLPTGPQITSIITSMSPIQLAAFATAIMAAMPSSALAAAITAMAPTLPSSSPPGSTILWNNGGVIEFS